MIGRVTQQSLHRSSLQHLQANLSRMQQLQTELSSGKAITKPSDDPAGTVDAMRLRSDQRAATQHGRNAADGIGWLTAVDSALSGSLSLLRNARDLTVQGASTGTMSDTSRNAIAAELEATSEALRAQANTTYLGRSVFAGTSAAGEAFSVTETDGAKAYTFTGAAASVERRVSANTTVRVDSDGATVFGTGEDSVFAVIDDIAARLRAGENVGDSLAALDTRLDSMLGEVGSVGTRYNQVMEAQDAIEARSVGLESQLSGVEDVDLAETIVELQIQEVAYNAALNATTRALQPSLLDFLR